MSNGILGNFSNFLRKTFFKIGERQEKVAVLRQGIDEGDESEGRKLWPGWILSNIAPYLC